MSSSSAGHAALRVGASWLEDGGAAARAAARSALAGARAPVAGLAFATSQLASADVAEALAGAFGELPWAGCTSTGVFVDGELASRGVVVGVFDAPQADAGVGFGSYAAGAQSAGAAAAATALAAMPLTPPGRRRLLVLLADPVSANVADVVRGAVGEAGAGVVWAGGGAGTLDRDDLAIFGGPAPHVRRDGVIALAVDVPRDLGAGVRHGWRPFGPPALVTRASGVVAEQLEYRQAFDVYREAAASDGTAVDEEGFADFAMLHPLGIPQAGQSYLVRDPLEILPGGALRCAGEIADGALIRFMRADAGSMVAAAAEAASSARARAGGELAAALVFDCVSRHLVLGGDFARELSAFGEALGAGVPRMGCLTFGEVGAFGDRVPQFHNKSAVVVALPR